MNNDYKNNFTIVHPESPKVLIKNLKGYKRVTPIWDFLKKSQKKKNETPHGDCVCESGSNAKVNRCFCNLTPRISDTPSLDNVIQTHRCIPVSIYPYVISPQSHLLLLQIICSSIVLVPVQMYCTFVKICPLCYRVMEQYKFLIV